ncbi:MAG: hypothetical protein ACR2MA_02435 [Egibacteraceae bacterium]
MSAETTVAPLTRAEWRVLVDAGVLDDQRVELLGGEKWHIAAEGPLHTLIIEALVEQLRAQLDRAAYHVRDRPGLAG